jgi:hypothetical protein
MIVVKVAMYPLDTVELQPITLGLVGECREKSWNGYIGYMGY